MPSPRVLIGYDGSEEARRAMDAAAGLVEGADALVLHVGEAPHPTVIGPAPGPVVPDPPPEVYGPAAGDAREAARDVAEQGVREATAAGFNATPLIALAGGPGDVAAAILAAADEHDVGLVVVGSRGRSALKRAILGSVSGAVVNGSHRPVLVVPPPAAHGGGAA